MQTAIRKVHKDIIVEVIILFFETTHHYEILARVPKMLINIMRGRIR